VFQRPPIELALANQGNLETSIQTHPGPTLELKAMWIRSLAVVLDHVDPRRVVRRDIGLRNILIHDSALKLCDFGESSLLLLDAVDDFFLRRNTLRVELII
jgi:serine/threonine protein kinase